MTISQQILFVFSFKTMYDYLSTKTFGEFYSID